MTTKTAPRGNTNTATLPNTRQPQARKTRTEKTARLNQPATPHNPLRGLFSDEELRQIDERCRMIGRSAAEVVISALKVWIKPSIEEDDAHLDNGEAPAPAQPSREQLLAPFNVLGKEIARTTNAADALELVYENEPHYFMVFEAIEVFKRGEWRTWWETKLQRGEKLENYAPHEIRRSFYFEPFQHDAVAEWFEDYGIAQPEAFSKNLTAFLAIKQIEEKEITQRAIRAERNRIAGAMSREIFS